MTTDKAKKVVRLLQERLNSNPNMEETWVTFDDKYVGIALTVEEAFALLEELTPDE